MNFWARLYAVESTWKRRLATVLLVLPCLLLYPFRAVVLDWRNTLVGAREFWRKR